MITLFENYKDSAKFGDKISEILLINLKNIKKVKQICKFGVVDHLC